MQEVGGLPKKRGRPRKVVEETVEEGSPKQIVAAIIARYCMTPGCRPQFHYDTAQQIIEALRGWMK